MLKEKTLYSLRDISIIPAVSTSIKSRKECNPFRKSIEGKEGWYPLIASPMDSVMDDQNWKYYWDNKISCVIPRSIPENFKESMKGLKDEEIYEKWFKRRRELCCSVFCAFSMKEARWFLENSFDGTTDFPYFSEGGKIHVLIDIANGSMQEEIDLGHELKKKFKDSIVLMGGNIGNPQTYLLYDQAGFDFLRIGIGSGQGCLDGNTKILMADGSEKPIKDLIVGDSIMSPVGIRSVEDIVKNTSEELITINDKLTLTPNHRVFVVNKDTVTDENILSLGYYIDAEELDQDKHLLARVNKDPEEIISIKRETVSKEVYDITVSGEEHNYIAEGNIVHNCLTSTSTAIHFPYASLISEISEMKERYHSHCKIVADGGMAWYSDIIKSLALGADYVMCGKIFSQAAKTPEEVGKALIYRGMSTKAAQAEMGTNGNLKTSEGKSMEVKKEYTLSGWTENFDSYLRSAMSYCDSRTLKEFREKAICQVISPNSSSQINNK